MNLVLRQGALRDGEGYTFTLHITDLTMGEEGFASIDLLPNQPPVGGFCHLSPDGPLRALMTKVHFECTGESTCQPPLLLITSCSSHRCSLHPKLLPQGWAQQWFGPWASLCA